MIRVHIVDYDERWQELYRVEAEEIRHSLGPAALRIEHTGSTSVPSRATYAPALERAGYVLTIREPEWSSKDGRNQGNPGSRGRSQGQQRI